ncbi:MAG: dodecin family protein [Pseudomonadales bacterium]
MTVAKTIEISADSTVSFEDAIKEGVKKAGDSVNHIQQAWIKNQVVMLNDGKVEGYRVHMNVTFEVK